MDCPPPIEMRCEEIREGAIIRTMPCTVAYYCSENIVPYAQVKKPITIEELVMSDKVKLDRLLERKP